MVQRLKNTVGDVGQAALTRMERDLPWFRQLSAEDRSWIGLIVQAGVNSFISWYREPGGAAAITADVFGTAPQALTRVVTLQQTVEMVRMSFEVVEQQMEAVVDDEDVAGVREAFNRYAREVAFSAAEVYARAAEMRGAWDARLEALVVDSVLRGEADEAVRSRAAVPPTPTRARPAASRTWTRSGAGPASTTWTRCARCRATGWWSCSAASATPPRPPG